MNRITNSAKVLVAIPQQQVCDFQSYVIDDSSTIRMEFISQEARDSHMKLLEEFNEDIIEIIDEYTLHLHIHTFDGINQYESKQKKIPQCKCLE